MSETILVTGASAGFGQAICRRLVADGYRVIGSARRIEKLQALQEELGEALSLANGCDGTFSGRSCTCQFAKSLGESGCFGQ